MADLNANADPFMIVALAILKKPWKQSAWGEIYDLREMPKEIKGSN